MALGHFMSYKSIRPRRAPFDYINDLGEETDEQGTMQGIFKDSLELATATDPYAYSKDILMAMLLE